MVDEADDGAPLPLPLLQVRQSSYAKFGLASEGRSSSAVPASVPEVPVGDPQELVQQRWKQYGYDPADEVGDANEAIPEAGDAADEAVEETGEAVDDTNEPLEESMEVVDDTEPSMEDVAWSGTPFSGDTVLSDLRLDLTEVIESHGFDSQSETGRYPARLVMLVTEPNSHIIWLALSGVSIIGYAKDSVNQVLDRLRIYLKDAIEKGWLDESAFLTDMIDHIRAERDEMRRIEEMESPEAMDERLSIAKIARDARAQEWGNKTVLVDSEEELALRSLELRYAEDQERLERVWNSPKMVARYNKPSPTLLEKRGTVRRMLTVHRFSEAARLADEIEAMEKFESAQAAAQMRRAYKAACDRLEKQFVNDTDSLRGGFATKRHQIERGKTQSLIPLGRRVDKFAQQKESFLESQKRNPPAARSRTPIVAARSTLRPDTTIGTVSEKLKLPVLEARKRPPSRITVSRLSSSLSKRNPGSNVATGRQSRRGNLDSRSDSGDEIAF
jgi:hypothetical protein